MAGGEMVPGKKMKKRRKDKRKNEWKGEKLKREKETGKKWKEGGKCLIRALTAYFFPKRVKLP